MKTYTKKKGRIAIAWLVIVTMVFATMYTPFAMAEDTPPTPATPGITFDLDTFGKYDISEGVEEDGYVTFRISDEMDFIIFKQGNLGGDKQVSYLWTPMEVNDTLKQDIVDQVVYWANHGGDGSLKDLQLSDLGYIYGFGVLGIYNYSITHDEANNEFVIVVDQEKLSHMTFGSYDEEIVPGTGQITLMKTFEGYQFVGEDFEFWLYEADKDWNQAQEPLQKVYNDINGAITFAPINYGEEDIDVDHHYIIIEKGAGPDNNTPDIVFDDQPIKVIMKVTLNDENEIVATPEFYGEKESFTNTFEEKEYGSIQVTKTITVPNGAEYNNPITFLFALFDEEGNIYEEYEPLEITVDPELPLSETGTFTGLDLNKVYSVYEVYKNGDEFLKIETDNEGNVTTEGIPVKMIKYTNNVDIEVNSETPAEVMVDNTLPSEEEGLTGSILVTKTVTVNNKPFTSNRTFYVGLFADEALTTLIDEKSLTPAGKYEASFDELEAGATFYVAETDGKGTALTKEAAKELGFEITIDGKKVEKVAVVIDGDMMVDLVNNFKSEEFPLTGDDSNMSLWLFLAMLGVAGALAPFAFRKKEVTND